MAEITFEKIPVPQPALDEVLVNFKYSGVCHTDLHAMNNDWPLPRKTPVVIGHEGSGIVVSKGSTVTGVSVSDRGDESLCPHATLSGYTVDGTFQQYAVANASLPKDVDAEKGEICKNLGAASFVDYKMSKSVIDDVKAASGRENLGPHAVLVLTPQEQPFQQATAYVRAHGAAVVIGLPAVAKISMPVFDTVVRMVTVKGSYVGSRQDMAEAIEFFSRGLIKAPYKVVGLSELQGVFKAMSENKVVGRCVLDMSK
ncbi:chaperonin 10-like protein [Lasiosphaeris hirsuta]|uniref:alcohol dehydrogenase n=1 Tax=Lasiosphaeris hirsuta TaxID=260670 RepID=A0AA40E6M1_9PEZI|nr:chaperonin 10-like protein [Lasiosphaeris hirsuta]